MSITYLEIQELIIIKLLTFTHQRIYAMKKLILILFSLASIISYAQDNCRESKQHFMGDDFYKKAPNTRSDSIDILHYTINLDFTDFSNKIMKGNCVITLTPKVNNINQIQLDLLKLTVDSIKLNNTNLTSSYNDTLLNVNFAAPIGSADTIDLIVYYRGTPQTDQSGWGGFYYQGNYAFNLGVGFAADPHNYGRVWFPCFDNFVERSTYTFNIITNGGRVAHCNGYLALDSVIVSDTIYRRWEMKNTMPTYLACVAICDYETVHLNHSGVNGNIPIEIAAVASDTNNAKNSFANLGNAIDAFEKWYGPYKWNKVGYSLVPFSSGAMEHATNIAYPRLTANGSLAYETLMAHELSHMWWGDHSTCETAEDMWINEGMAKYSEHIFLEWVYGRKRYLDEVKANHADVIQYAHFEEGQYRAISGIPHQYTYGKHVYDKGAAVAHNLRGYLGDSLFEIGLKAVMDSFPYTHVNSYRMRDVMSSVTGYNLTDFFNDWVLNPGFSHFSIDSFSVTAGSVNYAINIHLKQKKRGSVNFHNNVPLVITLRDANWNVDTHNIIMSGQNMSFVLYSPLNPVVVSINEENNLNIATTAENWNIKSSGSFNSGILAKGLLIVNSVTDSAFVRIEHHWAEPDPVKNNPNNYNISNYRYWKVDGIFPSGFDASLRFNYDGRLSGGNGTGYLDMDLVSITEDSLILLYRKDASDDWVEYSKYTKNTIGSSTNKYGFITIDSLIKGEYTFANGDLKTGIEETNKKSFEMTVYPNPTNDLLNIELLSEKKTDQFDLTIYDLNGKIVLEKKIGNYVSFPTDSLKSGNYIVKVKNSQFEQTQKVIINK